MRLPTYSHFLNFPAAPDLLFRLLETLLVMVCSLVAESRFGHAANAGYDSAVTAFAIVFALSLSSGLRLKRPARRALARHVLLPALGWIVCEALAVGVVNRMHRGYAPSMDWFVCLSGLTAGGVILCRLGERMAGARRFSVAVVGRGERCAAFVRRVMAMPDAGYGIGAVFDLDPESDACYPGALRLRDIETFAAHVRAHRINEVWLVLPLTDEATLQRFLETFRNDFVNIRFIPDVRGVARFRSESADLDTTLAINLVAAPLTGDAVAAKTLFDLVFATCAIVACAPLLIAIALAIKVSSRGPVLFQQRRHGANGQPFQIYKFRTMRAHQRDDGVVVQATRNDRRITGVGAFLRRTSLDELPQFFNVLRGDMSVVGPRPHAIEHDALYQNIVDDYIHRYRIKPGITGWAQVNGLRGETSSVEMMRQRVEHDLFYLSNWSFAFDLRIVAATVVRGLVHRNAY
ncbi:undecaprenyl-phosphate glucose phosphotransferase [Caballeronia sp. LZ032]|uniref:undecaprenyl-phosphate glucose phosphotransferase n=1 Tax=Caballeronia sp. LZ032 TaxID=3038565 RepID=UPI00285613CF|nr:undecaprenyl-phosphate glucose phosphotransferase [Caballeronia sp. LZ032]MDR5879446.1 undecaprenyl-phosphate glucose phosphotransferase [Caballeronia sp. LZ032]